MKNFRKQVQTDCLSSLHDDLLIHILSFVDIKHAAQTCVLSKRWNNKNLWRNHPDVYLDSTTFGKNSDKFKEYVDMVLAQRDELHLKLRSFSFTWTFRSMIPQKLLDKVHVYAQDHDVRHFSLNCSVSPRLSYPSRKFTPKSLTSLRLNLSNRYRVGFCYTDFNFRLQPLYFSGCAALKTLWLENISIKSSSGDVDFFSRLENLTELHIIGCFIIGQDGCFLISAPRLEKLTVLQNWCSSNADVPHWKISSPVLKYLKTDLCLPGPAEKFVEEIEIDLPSFEDDFRAKRVISGIRCLAHAKSVTLSPSTLQVISSFPDYEFKSGLQHLHFWWEHLKVITKKEHSATKFIDYLPALAVLTDKCFKTLKVEFCKL